MTEQDESPHLQPEPQEERGAKGSRDVGGAPEDEQAGRPAGDPHSKDVGTGVNPQGTATPEMDPMPAGDQGG
ncbi:MAG: hypothetical protein QOI42_952 [Frankiaceae bacterium]|jgi:hypothetical protein|nr:hypothetical protein [Frankiaceae bacterium]